MKAIETCGLVGVPYDESKVPIWVNHICEKSMEALIALEKPFKYMGKIWKNEIIFKIWKCKNRMEIQIKNENPINNITLLF